MAYIIDQPIIREQENWYEFENAHVLKPRRILTIDYRVGYRDPETGTVTRGELKNLNINEDAYDAVFAAQLGQGTSFGVAVETTAYALLKQFGAIPADAEPVP